MAWTQAQVTALEEAIASGALTVRHDDKTVTYRSLSEMRAILGEMKASMASPRRTMVAYVAHKRGSSM